MIIFQRAAHAMSRLFFGYLRSLANPLAKKDFGIPPLPKSLSGLYSRLNTHQKTRVSLDQQQEYMSPE